MALINQGDIKDGRLMDKIKNLSSARGNDFSAKVLHHSPNAIKYEIANGAETLVFFNEI